MDAKICCAAHGRQMVVYQQKERLIFLFNIYFAFLSQHDICTPYSIAKAFMSHESAVVI